MNTNLPKIHEDEKQGILDVRLTMNNNTEIDIEIQVAYMKAWADRSTFYVSKMLVEQVGINKKYSNIKKCIGINILDFKYMDDTQRFHTVYHLREDTEHIKYTDVMEIHIVELPKLPQNTDGTDLYSWIKFIKSNDKEEFEMLAQQSKYLGVEKGIEQGKQQGMEQAQTEMIIKLYKKGKSPEQIAYDFDFPIEQVNSVIKNVTAE